jgi:hypothetical protein
LCWIELLFNAFCKNSYKDQLTTHIANLKWQVFMLNNQVSLQIDGCSINQIQHWISGKA